MRHFKHFFIRKLITATFFVENASKRYYVTAEMMKRRYLFDIMLSLVGYLFRYISQHILEE